MDEEIQETTQENPIVEEPIVEEKPQETETPKETKVQYTDLEKRLYARAKKAEEMAKEAKEALVKARVPISDIDAILEVQSSTRDLDAQEIGELKLRATALGASLTEARKDPNYLIWQTGYREKVAKENAAKPSTLQPEVTRPKTLEDELREVNKLPIMESIEKKAEILEREGRWKNPRRRPISERIRLSQNQ